MEKINRFDRKLEEYCRKYCLRTDLELVRQELITLGTRVEASELEVAEAVDKVLHSLSRNGARVRRQVQEEAPVAVSEDPITDQILERRKARAVHAE